MVRISVEIGHSFHKTGSPGIVWTVDSFNEFTEPMHVRLTRLDETHYLWRALDHEGEVLEVFATKRLRIAGA